MVLIVEQENEKKRLILGDDSYSLAPLKDAQGRTLRIMGDSIRYYIFQSPCGQSEDCQWTSVDCLEKLKSSLNTHGCN